MWADNKDYKLSYYTFGEDLVEGGSVDLTDSSTIIQMLLIKLIFPKTFKYFIY